MCGIAGLVHLDGRPVDREMIQRMVALMPHRGPDASGVFVHGNVALGHTRLSILDVSSAGAQPMTSTDDRHTVVFNGEIYNFRALRSELEQRGHHFASNSDTEVLLAAYIEWGQNCLARLNGMFGFAIYDHERGEIFLARDRFGIKPLHYALVDRTFCFASEMRPIKEALGGRIGIDRLKILELLIYRELAEDTLFVQIRNLEPGSFLSISVDGGAPQIDSWFSVEEQVDPERALSLRSMRYEQRVEALEQELLAAVERHLVSDVPVGTLCSGGVDSSLLTALACKINPRIGVYHVDVEGMSELSHAERVANHLGVDLHKVTVSRENYLQQYVECIFHNEAPLSHPNSIGIYYISALARDQRCKVLLTGEGADEGFGGYAWRYRSRLKYRRLERLSALGRKIYNRLVFLLTDVWPKRFQPEFGFRARARVPDVVDFCADRGFRSGLWNKCLRAYGFVENPTHREVLASMLSDYRDYINALLHRQDRASMQASIESRVPFLDPELTAFIVNLPLKDKIKGSQEKVILKDLATRHLPREVVHRPKVGFGMPVIPYVREIGKDIFRDGFLEQTFRLLPDQTMAFIDQNLRNNCHMLYGLEIWGRLFVRGESIAEVKRFLPL